MDWNPALYEQFRRYRERPAADLLSAVTAVDPALIYDLGCGTGRITRQLAERYPDAEVVGLDISSTMLDRDPAEDASNLRFESGDIATWSPPVAPEVIFSNAALHWLPEHAELFPRLVGLLAPGGHLYVQMPRNFAEPDHQTIRAVVHEGRWADRLLPLWTEARTAIPDDYVKMLGAVCAELDVWETVYYQRLEGPNPVARWIEGAALRPYLAALGDEKAEFMAAISRRILAAYPPDGAGITLYPFRRLFIAAIA